MDLSQVEAPSLTSLSSNTRIHSGEISQSRICVLNHCGPGKVLKLLYLPTQEHCHEGPCLSLGLEACVPYAHEMLGL